MRYGILFGLAVILTCCLAVITPGCNNHSSGKIEVVATTSMIADLMKNIGGDRLDVTGLMGPGVDPHEHSPTADDIDKLSRADIIFYNGLHLEGKMTETFEKMNARKKKTVAITKDLDPAKDLRHVEGFEGTHDPHVWFDVQLWMKSAQTVCDELAAFDPPGAAQYRANTEKYLAELKKLDAEVRDKANTLPTDRRVLVTAHDAFFYFGRAYGFEVHGLQGVSTVEEAGPKDVAQLAEFIVSRKVPALFVESSVNQKNMVAVQRAVESRGWKVTFAGAVNVQDAPLLYSDALGNPGEPAGTYIGMVRHNIDTIVNALK